MMVRRMIKRRRLKINSDDVIKCPVSCHCSALQRKILPASWLRLLCKTWINAFTFHLHTFPFSSEAHSHFHFSSAHYLFLIWATLSLSFLICTLPFPCRCTLSLSHPRRFKGRVVNVEKIVWTSARGARVHVALWQKKCYVTYLLTYGQRADPPFQMFRLDCWVKLMWVCQTLTKSLFLKLLR